MRKCMEWRGECCCAEADDEDYDEVEGVVLLKIGKGIVYRLYI